MRRCILYILERKYDPSGMTMEWTRRDYVSEKPPSPAAASQSDRIHVIHFVRPLAIRIVPPLNDTPRHAIASVRIENNKRVHVVVVVFPIHRAVPYVQCPCQYSYP